MKPGEFLDKKCKEYGYQHGTELRTNHKKLSYSYREVKAILTKYIKYINKEK